jgi:hypothetical protein
MTPEHGPLTEIPYLGWTLGGIALASLSCALGALGVFPNAKWPLAGVIVAALMVLLPPLIPIDTKLRRKPHNGHKARPGI